MLPVLTSIKTIVDNKIASIKVPLYRSKSEIMCAVLVVPLQE